MHIFDRFAYGLAKLMAYFGGGILLSLIAVTCASVIGRSLNTIGNMAWLKTSASPLANFLQAFGPISGDFELVEMGIAASIFLFLPWCQLNRGHASVDLLTAKFLSERANRLILLIWEALLAVALILITWRLYAGMRDKILFGETTFLLQWPVWWAYAFCFVAGILASFVSVYCVIARLNESISQNSNSQKTSP